MTRRLGRTQRQIKNVLQEHPGKWFTNLELAKLAYPATEIGRAQLNAVRRALQRLVLELGLERVSGGICGQGGWHFSYRMTGAIEDPERAIVMKKLAQLKG